MYLSRVAIDTKKYEAMKALYNLEKLHGMVEHSFNGERVRNLWRIDKLAGKDYLLLLSHVPPENNNLPEQIGFTGAQWEIKLYDGLLSKIQTGSRWHFRITANPTMCIATGEQSRGKVKAITVAAKQREWLIKQSTKKGFSLVDSEFDVVKSEWKTFSKENGENRILSVSFEGILTVSDADVFRKTLIEGIGREKAYGMGLLTVVPHA